MIIEGGAQQGDTEVGFAGFRAQAVSMIRVIDFVIVAKCAALAAQKSRKLKSKRGGTVGRKSGGRNLLYLRQASSTELLRDVGNVNET